MRLHPAGFGPFPRIVPTGGAEIEGMEMSPGTVASSSTIPLHQNATVFPELDEWRPERRIDATEEQSREMMRWFWVFRSGARMCIGRHLAVRVIKAFVVAIATEFEGSVAGGKMPEQFD